MVKANQGEKVTKKPLSPPKTDGVQFQASDGFCLYKKTDIIYLFKYFRCVFIPVGLFLLSTIPLPSEGIRGKLNVNHYLFHLTRTNFLSHYVPLL